ncbi:Crotonobetainyl-CoA:carnitine CoA-transferase CaiB [Brevibacterium jeotgali]|uniref:Crotonobetainyl-CoA:carnitine CoA-transferase CaiB n=1 Tax=Brevibacterium jeotgali TaxID=1262550 RepID=A0A2H1L5D4_9MICO|nr:CoA transferase [Brevibacterium jeotgali]SMY12106.1 Crotonobetainyl-CoA:carnitine CoA-transferase CaiB [Brevibacterium jeotgali]
MTEQAGGGGELPLSGYRVVDLGQYIAAPGAAAVLGELGAEVVKIEPPSGDQARLVGPTGEAMVRAYNAGKESIVLDLRSEEGKRRALEIIADADVLVVNARPGSLERLGLGPDECLALNPRLVYGRISGFGFDGPLSKRPGLDIAAQAESGMMSINGSRDSEPMRVGFTAVDACAAEVLAQGILAALLRTGRTGRGGVVETSLLEVAIRMQATLWEEYFASGEVPIRAGNGQPSMAPAAEVIATRDGHIVLSAYADSHWRRLCELLGRTDLIEDPRFVDNAARVQNRAALRESLAGEFAEEPSELLVSRLSEAGIVAGVVRDYAQVLAVAEHAYPGLFRRQPSTGDLQLGLAYRVDGQRIDQFRPVPDAGANGTQPKHQTGA